MKKLKLLLFGFIITITISYISCEKESNKTILLKNGLILYYPFNENANDESENNYHGIINGATLTQDRFGIANSAFKFDGENDYIKINDVGDHVPNEEITVSMWLKPNASKPQFQLMLCPDNNRFAISAYYFHDGMNTIFWDYGWNGQVGDAPGRLYFRPEPIDTLWHHYAFVSSIAQSKMKIYKDGNLLIEKDFSQPLLNSTGKDLKIGSGDSNLYYNGIIDDIRIYNRILTIDEINQLFNEK